MAAEPHLEPPGGSVERTRPASGGPPAQPSPPATRRGCEDRSRWRSGGGVESGGAEVGSEAADQLTELQLATLPWHEMQLHLMFGRRFASDVVHPPMELRRQAKFKSRMRQLEGRTGAKALWSSLRDTSNRKLVSLDDKIPAGLKRTYGAFVRQLLLQNGLVPAKRNFTTQDDVEKMELLIDKSMTLRTKDKRHKAELMSRSSKVNVDRMQILAYNSSFPDLVNSSGEEGIDRYLPSLSRAQASNSAIGRQGCENTSDGSRSSVKVKVEPGLEMRPDSSLLAIEASLSAPRQPMPPSERIRFLTEREAMCEGQFSSHFRGLQHQRSGMVKPADNDDDKSAPPTDGAAASSAHPQAPEAGVNSEPEADARRRRLHKQPRLPANHRPWQPLTLKALVEYSRSAEPTAGGTSEFLFGRAKTFPLKVHNGSSGLKIGLPSGS